MGECESEGDVVQPPLIQLPLNFYPSVLSIPRFKKKGRKSQTDTEHQIGIRRKPSSLKEFSEYSFGCSILSQHFFKFGVSIRRKNIFHQGENALPNRANRWCAHGSLHYLFLFSLRRETSNTIISDLFCQDERGNS